MVENEIQFLSWEEFRQMTPSILGLEISRLAQVLAEDGRSTQERNTLVVARHELRRFVGCVAEVEPQQVTGCGKHLAAALLAAAFVRGERDSTALSYVIGRLQYVQDRMAYIY